MLRRFSTDFAIFSMFMDALIVVLSLWLADLVRPYLNGWWFIQHLPGPVHLPSVLYLVFPLIYLVVLASLAIYDGRRYLRVADELTALTLAFIIASVSSAGILYFSFRQISRALFLLFLVFAYAGLIAQRSLVRFFFRLRRDWLGQERRVLLVGTGAFGQRVRAQFQAENIRLVGLIGDEGDPPAGAFEAEDVRRAAIETDATDVVIALPYSAYQHMAAIVNRLEDVPVHVWVALGFFDLALYQLAVDDFAGIPMLDLRAAALNDVQRLVKRAFDIVVGLLLMIVALPLMGLIALAVLLFDGRPVIFRQERAGENGRPFTMYKFRTMVKELERRPEKKVNESERLIHKRRDDPRVTPLGRFLRRTSLDELPQLFNVLEGTMSLVGPRPELLDLVEQYQPWQRQRFTVPPGMTGWWQVTGRSDKPMYLHTEDDLYYIRNYSIWLDIQILIRTVWVVLIGRGSY